MEHLANEPLPWLEQGAVFAGDEDVHRVWLSRKLRDPEGGPVKPVIFIGHNPSTADATQNDNTIRRCINFSIALDATHLVMINPCSFRATDARKIPKNVDLSCTSNWLAIDAAIKLARTHGATLIACWGSPKGVAHNQKRIADLCYQVRFYCHQANVPLHALRFTGKGHPEHPLYLPGDSRPQPYPFDLGLEVIPK